jgi:cell division inhibitor SepF
MLFSSLKKFGDMVSGALMAPGTDERSYEDSYENDYDDDYANYEEDEPVQVKSSSRKAKSSAASPPVYSRTTRDNIVGFSQSAVVGNAPKTPAETVIKHPQTMMEAIEIGSHIRSGRMCIVELTGVNDKEAQRIVDFLYGYVAAIDGAITRVNRFNTLAVSPPAHRVMVDYNDNDGGPFPDAGFLKKTSSR